MHGMSSSVTCFQRRASALTVGVALRHIKSLRYSRPWPKHLVTTSPQIEYLTTQARLVSCVHQYSTRPMTQGETTGHTTESQPTAPLPSSPAIQTSYDNIFRSIPELQEAHDALATYAESLGLGRPGPNQYSALIAASQKHPELCQHLLHIFYLLHVYQLIEGPTERINHKSITMQLPKGQSAKVVGLSMPSSQLQLEMAQVRAKRAAGLSDPPKEINAPTFWAQIWHIVKKGLK